MVLKSKPELQKKGMKIKHIIIIIVSIILFIVFIIGMLQMAFTTKITKHELSSYSCEEISNALLSGNCLQLRSEKTSFLYFFKFTSESGCWNMNDLYVNYKFRCEDK